VVLVPPIGENRRSGVSCGTMYNLVTRRLMIPLTNLVSSI
jgi:hypothetical protein